MPVQNAVCADGCWLRTSLLRFSAPLRWEFTPHFIQGPVHWKQAQPVRFTTGCPAHLSAEQVSTVASGPVWIDLLHWQDCSRQESRRVGLEGSLSQVFRPEEPHVEFHQQFVRLWEGLSHRSQGKLCLWGSVRPRPVRAEDRWRQLSGKPEQGRYRTGPSDDPRGRQHANDATEDTGAKCVSASWLNVSWR